MFERRLVAMTRIATKSGTRALQKALKPVVDKRTPPPGCRSMDPRRCDGRGGARRFRLYRPPDVKFSERLPLMVMLHGCGQDAKPLRPARA